MMTTTLFLLMATGDQYLTRDQALKLALPDAERVLDRSVTLDEKTRARVQERYGSSVAPTHSVFLGLKEGKVTAYAMILTEVTKTLKATFVVAISPTGEVTEVAVLSHEDHIGTDCRKGRFVSQFRGKTTENRLAVPNGGILPVSGATLSCQAVARSVRMALAIVQYHFIDQPDNVKAALVDEPVRQKRYVMGTFLTITAYGPSEAVEKAFEEVKRLDRVLSNYDDRSELSALNRLGKVNGSADLLCFIRESQRFSEESDGAFDITVAPLVRLWGFKDGKHRVPAQKEIEEALKTVGSRRIGIEGDAVRLPKGMELDPGAIGKGMAVDGAAEVLKKAGIKRALVDFGSSAYAIGTWEVEIRDPFDREKSIGRVTLQDEALSTAGSYEKCFEKEGRTYTHILDPRTGWPVEGVASVSVIAPTGAESDALDTAIFVRKALPEKGAVLLVPAKGAMSMTEGWGKKFKKREE